MNGDIEVETPRARPVSGGLWSLFSWLRRDERSSVESLSSVGSDRTAASFDFLAPSHYPGPAPLVLPPPGPPTDSYKKRLRERNLRRHYEHDLTLHRKYGLLRCEGAGNYNTFSLPSACSNRRTFGDLERDRRAISECEQRRTVHVVGKRRAPAPPALSYNTTTAASLTRRSRKRPAPQPPTRCEHKTQEIEKNYKKPNNNIDILNLNSIRKDKILNSDMSHKEEKSNKNNASKKDKLRSEKSFLKLIFDNKKRNSVLVTPPEKVLPNISELDKQAAEIIKMKKANLEQNNNVVDNRKELIKNSSSIIKNENWFCTRCLRKYNASIDTCLYCKPENSSNSQQVSDLSKCNKKEDVDELKRMLKEMKNSLPKRPKPSSDNTESRNIVSEVNEIEYIDTPTLRIGAKVHIEKKPLISQTYSRENIKNRENLKSVVIAPARNLNSLNANETAVVSKTVAILDSKTKCKEKSNAEEKFNTENIESTNIVQTCSKIKTITKDTEEPSEKNENIILNTPLKISSLLNPMYIPKQSTSNTQTPRSKFFSQIEFGNNFETCPLLKVKSLITSNTKMSPEHNSNENANRKTFAAASKMSDVTPILPKMESKTVPVVTQSSNVNEPVNAATTCYVSIAKPVLKHQTFLTETPIPLPGDSSDNQPLVLNNILISQQQIKPRTAETKAKQNNNQVSFKPDSLPYLESMQAQLLSPTITSELVTDLTVATKEKPSSKSSQNQSRPNTETSQNQYSKRREIIKQLEQSIAKGDERAAADAAVKLAQQRLSCSVLSFSSQIVGDTFSADLNLKRECSSRAKDSSKVKETSESTSKINASTQATSSMVTKKLNNKEIVKPLASYELKIEKIQRPSSSKNNHPKATTSRIANSSENSMVAINVWVEDREAARGPVGLRVHRDAALGELRRAAEISLGVTSRLQRWIVGHTLCMDDAVPLVSLAGTQLDAPFYLCLVEDTKKEVKFQLGEVEPKIEVNDGREVYSELVRLEKKAVVLNTDVFECGICMEECPIGRGAVLRDCVHAFCRECLVNVIRHSEEAVVSCPGSGCNGVLQEREIRGLVPSEEYERWLRRGLAAAESGTRNSFHCRTRDCTGWALCEPGVRRFPCPVCKHINCVPCKAIHEGETCEQYRAKLEEAENAVKANQTDESTRALFDSLISRGEALECPECKTMILKKWGCDWVKCAACKTEICWVTRGRRWGPAGRGDTSDGCRCGVDGKRCHPSCGYCH